VRAGVSVYVVGDRAPECIAPILDAAIARFDPLQVLRTARDSVKSQRVERTLSPCLFLVPPWVAAHHLCARSVPRRGRVEVHGE